MYKKKYLHRSGSNNYKNLKDPKKNIHGDELPFREPMKKRNREEYYSNGLDFTPAYEYIKSNANKNWNIVYSDILKKIKPKYRHKFENFLKWTIYECIYINYEPYIKKAYWNNNLKSPIKRIFIDDDNILRYYKTEKELKEYSLKKIRKQKLLKLKKLYSN